MKVTAIQFPLGAEYSAPARSVSTAEPRIVVSGAFQNPAVGAGLEEFLAHLYPTIRTRLPSAHLTVWGAIRPSAAARSMLRRLPEILHVDYVEDYVTFLGSFDLFVYPQRYGVGVQTKVQQAMALGVPVVARPNVLRGVGAVHRVHAFGHDDNDSFAASVVALAEDAALRRRVGDEAALLIRRGGSPDQVWARLWAAYRLAVATTREALR
jgi:glycosyltransferase involved in cell wall biosynthesis